MPKKKADAAPKTAPADANVPDALSGEEKPKKQKATQPAKEKRIKILIPSSGEFDGKDDVFVSANGRDYQIMRDVEVEVPEIVVNVLRDAKKTDHITDKAGRIIGSREVARFPFQTL